MKKFIAYVKQYGEGCDYTIGCGQTLWELDAESLEQARVELEKEASDYNDENALKSITLYEVSHSEDMPVQEWENREKLRVEEAKKRAEETAERIEFERLKKKFD